MERFDETLTVACLLLLFNTFSTMGSTSGGNMLGRWNHIPKDPQCVADVLRHRRLSDISFGDHRNFGPRFPAGFHVAILSNLYGDGLRSITKERRSLGFLQLIRSAELVQYILQAEISLV